MKTLHMKGSELSDRFIGILENAGLNPWMFNEGQANDDTDFYLTEEQCLALRMSIYEFQARTQEN